MQIALLEYSATAEEKAGGDMSDIEEANKTREEELLAAGEYEEHLSKAKSRRLKRILKHNQKDEVEDHARKLKKYVDEEEAKKVYV